MATVTRGSLKYAGRVLRALPDAALDEVEAVLKGRTLGDADAAVTVTQPRVHGHGTISRSAPFVSASPTTGITHSDQQRRYRRSKPAHNVDYLLSA
jgi:hypothetical protein